MDNLVKDVECYELFEGMAPKNHAFSFLHFHFFFAEFFRRNYYIYIL